MTSIIQKHLKKKERKTTRKRGRITLPDHNTYFTFFGIIGSIQQTVYNI